MNNIKEYLYQTIKTLVGPKHPHFNYDALNQCANRLRDTLESFGLTVEDQEFYVYGDQRPYRNIFAYWGEVKPDMTIIGSHYDTVPHSPGANDNLSAVAVSIELARLISIQHDKPNIGFVFFTLEEGHPGYYEKRHRLLFEHEIIDAHGTLVSASLVETTADLQNFLKQNPSGTYSERLQRFSESQTLGAKELQYLSILGEVHKEFSAVSPTGKPNYTVGSHHFVEAMHAVIGRALVMDCLGWVDDERKVYEAIPLQGLENFLSSYQATKDQNSGNYLAFMGSVNTHHWLNELHGHCSTAGTDFPHIALKLPLPYESIKEVAPDTLRSDHAPFWRKGIPAIFISDTANFRSNLYHTPADTIEHINFSFLTKLVHALYLFLK